MQTKSEMINRIAELAQEVKQWKHEYEILDACIELEQGKMSELKAENDKLKKEIKNNKSAYEVELGTYNMECGNLLEENKNLLDENERLKEEIKQYKKYKFLFEKAKEFKEKTDKWASKCLAENEDLKDTIKKTVCQAECFRYKQANKYKQTLQEIKDYLSTLSGIDNDFVNTETYLRILDLITKAEEE